MENMSLLAAASGDCCEVMGVVAVVGCCMNKRGVACVGERSGVGELGNAKGTFESIAIHPSID
jgi:hypothetical protein